MSQRSVKGDNIESILKGFSMKTAAQILNSLKIRLVSNLSDQKHSATYKKGLFKRHLLIIVMEKLS